MEYEKAKKAKELLEKITIKKGDLQRVCATKEFTQIQITGENGAEKSTLITLKDPEITKFIREASERILNKQLSKLETELKNL